MSWLRIDDGYDTHPKLLELTEQQRWRWTRVLIHCARHDTRGHVKVSVLRELGLSRAIPRLLAADLLEENGADGYIVHDWRIYNGLTIEEKVAAYLETYPDASANSVFKAIGGKREIVLAVVSQFRADTQPGSQSVPPQVPGNHPEWFPSGSRARAPVPSPEVQDPSSLPLDVGGQEIENGYTPEELEQLAETLLEDMPA